MIRRPNPNEWRIGLVGYGEVGRILAEDLCADGLQVSACDIKLANAAGSKPLREHADALGVHLSPSHAEAIAEADLVICAVTADQTLAAAESCQPAIRKGAYYLDLNSVSPRTKQCAAAIVESSGGHYIEGAVMATVPAYRRRVPMLLGGASTEAFCPLINALGFDARVASMRLGVASATKMCRSVMIKGLEAIVIEGLTAARHYGVEDAVLTSLVETYPKVDWEQQATQFFQRVIEHGRRRSEEMREVERTVCEAGLGSWIAAGIAERQAWMADLADAGVFGPKGADGFARGADWRTAADCVLAARLEE